MTAELAVASIAAGELSEWADVGYTRISDDRTGVAASPARQRRAIQELAAREGRTITHWFQDLSKSASKPGVVRDEFDRLLQCCAEQPVDRIWTLHDDRLVRDGDDKDLPRLIKAVLPRRIVIRCVEASDLRLWQAEGKMSMRVRNAVNAYESERKRERVELSTADRARRGRFSGGTRRFGYAHDAVRIVRQIDDAGQIHEFERPSGQLVLVPAEAEAIAAGARMIADGKTLYSVLRDWRDTRKLVGVKGAELTALVVRDVLLRPMNAGLSSHKGVIVGTGDWPAIIDPELYASVKAILQDPARRTNRGRPATHLLSGILRCGTCQRPMLATLSREAGSYRCKSGGALADPTPGQRHVSRRRKSIDDAMTDLVLKRIERNADKIMRPAKPKSKSVAKAVEEVAMLRGKIAAYLARADEFEPDDLAAMLRTLRARLAKADAQITKAAGKPATAKLLASGDIFAAWRALDVRGRREVFKEQLNHVLVGPGTPGRYSDAMQNVVPDWRRD